MAGIKEKMQRARQLIKAKRYDEARAILRTVDHDKAYEWLDKLDKIAPANKPTSSETTRKSGRIKSKTLTVSSRSLIGKSQMDKTIERYQNRGWRLVEQRQGDKEHQYILRFEYTMSDDEVKAQNRRRVYYVLGFGLLLMLCGLYSNFTSSQAARKAQATETQVAFIAATDAAVAQVTMDAQSTLDVYASETATLWTSSPTFTSSPIPTVTDTPSITPTYTITPTPTASATVTHTATIDPLIITVAAAETSVQLTRNAPTATPAVFIPTELPEAGMLRDWLSQQEGVDVVQSMSVRGQDGLLFYAEVIVYPGFNDSQLAEAFNAASMQAANGREIDQVAIIMSDGEQAIDYTLNSFADDWQITRLTSVDPPTPRPNPNITNTQSSTTTGTRTTMYASLGEVRVRSCPDTTNPACGVVDILSRGDRITVYQIVQGSVYAGSTEWYRAEHNGREVYVHSELVQSSPPPAPTSVPAPSVNTNTSSSSGSGSTNNVRPDNCDEARAMGLTAEQAAQWSHLDRDNDGVACYGD